MEKGLWNGISKAQLLISFSFLNSMKSGTLFFPEPCAGRWVAPRKACVFLLSRLNTGSCSSWCSLVNGLDSTRGQLGLSSVDFALDHHSLLVLVSSWVSHLTSPTHLCARDCHPTSPASSASLSSPLASSVGCRRDRSVSPRCRLTLGVPPPVLQAHFSSCVRGSGKVADVYLLTPALESRRPP